MTGNTRKDQDKPFPLKQYYLLYAGIGGVIFYGLLFLLLVHTVRQSLYEQYVESVTDKARAFYHDINRDFLAPRQLTFDDINPEASALLASLHDEIAASVESDFAVAQVKVFNSKGIILYDSIDHKSTGTLYPSVNEEGFRSVLAGNISSKAEVSAGGQRLMEVYLPIKQEGSGKVVGILELYENVSRFENHVSITTRKVMVLPTLVFVVFNIVLFLVVAKADRIIATSTNLLVAIRQNMEKYLSGSAIDAIYQAVHTRTELFKGERQEIIIFFSDIRGFTSYSESREPETVVNALNKVFQIQADCIHERGGVIDKFVGDEIMAVFPADKAIDAVSAALDIIDAIAASPDKDFKVGIGIHGGEAVVGSLGTYERRDYTAIGDTVNTGARLCAAAEPGEILLSTQIVANLDESTRLRFQKGKRLQVKGKAEAFKVYSNKIGEVGD